MRDLRGFHHDPQHEKVMQGILTAEHPVERAEALELPFDSGVGHGATPVVLRFENVSVQGQQQFWCHSRNAKIIKGKFAGDGTAIPKETPFELHYPVGIPRIQGRFLADVRITRNNGEVHAEALRWFHGEKATRCSRIEGIDLTFDCGMPAWML